MYQHRNVNFNGQFESNRIYIGPVFIIGEYHKKGGYSIIPGKHFFFYILSFTLKVNQLKEHRLL